MNPIYDLIDKNPSFVYTKIFSMRHITIRIKLKIISACLNDERIITLEGSDPLTRNQKVIDAAKSLDKIIAKQEKKKTPS